VSVRTYYECQLDIIAITTLWPPRSSGAGEVRATSFGAWTSDATLSASRFHDAARGEHRTERVRVYLSGSANEEYGSAAKRSARS
jgi:hypothetical protein